MTSDTELDFLKGQMDAAKPAPDAARRAENLAAAMENFDRAQGTASEARQSKDRPKAGFLAGVWTMLTTRSAALTGTTALVAGVLLITNPFADLMSRPAVESSEFLTDFAPILGEAEVTTREEDGAGLAAAPAIEIVVESEAEPLLQPSYVPLEPPAVQQITADQLAFTEVPAQGQTSAPISGRDQAEAEDSPEASSTGTGLALSGSAEMGIMGGDDSTGYFSDGNLDRITPGDNDSRLEFGALTRGDVDGAIDQSSASELNTESFPEADPSPLQVTSETPVSTFSIDVDTASYALLRSSLSRGQMPAPEAVRIEEMVNYFSYDYPAPGPEAEAPFEPSFTVFETPWNPDTQLVHIALQGEMPETRPPLNLVFLIDVSGSMDDPAKLPLLIQSFRLMLDRLDPQDQVAIVTYAGNTGVALEPTAASERSTIERALTSLRAGGSTNGVGGLEAAYALANDMTEEGELSRVILATDGDFNVGLSDPSRLSDYIAEQRESGTYLSVLGFGRGNLQDATMQALAQNGNGTAAYIDTLHEAQRVLVDQLSGVLFPIADDVKVQVEFNPARVAEYRLIGYETRALAREDFNNDTVDAGELGAGHRVTAIYEITPVGSPAIRTDPLRYGEAEPLPTQADALSDEIGFLRLRWKEPGEEVSQLMDFPVTETGAPSSEVLFATAIAGFGQLLQSSEFLGVWDYGDAIALANDNRGADAFGLRSEAVQLMRLADSLSAN